MVRIVCPVCRLPMQARTYEGKFVEQCSGCLGHWLPRAKLQHIIVTRLVKFDTKTAQALARSSSTRSIPPSELIRRLDCPTCRIEMTTRRFADDSPVVINRCFRCEGVWLDHFELEQIQMIVEAIDDLLRG